MVSQIRGWRCIGDLTMAKTALLQVPRSMQPVTGLYRHHTAMGCLSGEEEEEGKGRLCRNEEVG